jgi:hypothetical protein
MTYEPKIPVLPGQRPSQRIYEVIQSPVRPVPFDSYVSVGLPDGFGPRNRPRSPTYLGQVERAGSPAHRMELATITVGTPACVLFLLGSA